jgi:Protein  of unknown function (DUF3018)
MTTSRKKPVPPSQRMSDYRARLRAAGFRQVQLWLPDTKSPAFAAKVRRQCRAIAADDPAGREMDAWIESAFEWPKA